MSKCGQTARAQREKCKYLVHLCMAASVIKERDKTITKDHVLLTSLLLKLAISTGTIWDTGPQSIKTLNPALFPVANVWSQCGIVIYVAHYTATIDTVMTQPDKLP